MANKTEDNTPQTTPISKDELIWAVDPASPDGDHTAISALFEKQWYTFYGKEAEATATREVETHLSRQDILRGYRLES